MLTPGQAVAALSQVSRRSGAALDDDSTPLEMACEALRGGREEKPRAKPNRTESLLGIRAGCCQPSASRSSTQNGERSLPAASFARLPSEPSFVSGVVRH